MYFLGSFFPFWGRAGTTARLQPSVSNTVTTATQAKSHIPIWGDSHFRPPIFGKRPNTECLAIAKLKTVEIVFAATMGQYCDDKEDQLDYWTPSRITVPADRDPDFKAGLVQFYGCEAAFAGSCRCMVTGLVFASCKVVGAPLQYRAMRL